MHYVNKWPKNLSVIFSPPKSGRAFSLLLVWQINRHFKGPTVVIFFFGLLRYPKHVFETKITVISFLFYCHGNSFMQFDQCHMISSNSYIRTEWNLSWKVTHLFCDSPDVIWFKSTAAANIPHSQIIGPPSVLMHIPTGYYSRLIS